MIVMKRQFMHLLLLVFPLLTQAQFTQNDSIRGGYGQTRNWWDVIHYDLTVTFDSQQKSISGKNSIRFQLLTIPENARIQIDLQAKD